MVWGQLKVTVDKDLCSSGLRYNVDTNHCTHQNIDLGTAQNKVVPSIVWLWCWRVQNKWPGEMATLVSHMKNPDMVQIQRREGEKKKTKAKTNKTWWIALSKYFLRIFVFSEFFWPFELWKWNVNIENHWRHCKIYFPSLCQTFILLQSHSFRYGSPLG